MDAERVETILASHVSPVGSLIDVPEHEARRLASMAYVRRSGTHWRLTDRGKAMANLLNRRLDAQDDVGTLLRLDFATEEAGRDCALGVAEAEEAVRGGLALIKELLMTVGALAIQASVPDAEARIKRMERVAKGE